MKLDLSEFFIYLITKKNFYGRLVSSLARVMRKGIGTMAVGLRDSRPVFFWDPSFLDDLTLPAGLFALEHEMLHLVLDHIPRYLELLALQPNDEARVKAMQVYNIAMDCAINTMLREHEGFNDAQAHLKKMARASYDGMVKKMTEEAAAKGEAAPEIPPFDESKAGMCLPEMYDLPLEGSFESYQYQLMQRIKVQKISVEFGGNTHEFWMKGEANSQGQGQGKGQGKGQHGDGSESFSGSAYEGMSSDELLGAAHRIREQIKETLRQTVKSIGGLGRGTLPGSLEEWLDDYLAPPITPWWEIFTTYAKMSRAAKYRRSCTLPNRALLALSEEDNRIIPAPGRVRDQSWRIFFMVDTSGSMSSESLEIAKSELFHMLAVDDSMEIRYMQGDCVVQSDVVLKTGDEIPKEVFGRGGTDFTAYFAHMAQYVNQDDKAPDLVVVYTDGYAPPVDPEHRLPDDIPVIWLVTPQHSAQFAEGYGTVIVCDPAHNERRKN